MRDLLLHEFERRRAANPGYSLRAFGRDLGVDHSSLSQILRGTRPVPLPLTASLGSKLGLSREEIAVYRAAAQVPDAQTEARQQQVRHWTAEAIQLLRDNTHQQLLALCTAPDFQPDLRWIAGRLQTDITRITLVYQRLLRLGFLEMASATRWRDIHNLGSATPREFRRAALNKIRELSPVHLPKTIPCQTP
jgi:transcriptional regulator with XRE-family HTH domain